MLQHSCGSAQNRPFRPALASDWVRRPVENLPADITVSPEHRGAFSLVFYFHWIRCFMQSLKCRRWDLNTAQLWFMPCLRDNKSTSIKSACRSLDSLMWLQNKAMVSHVRYLAHGEMIQNQLCRRAAKICRTSPGAKASAGISVITRTLQVCCRSPHVRNSDFKKKKKNEKRIWDSITTV